MFEVVAGAENPRLGGKIETWHGCNIEELREFRAIEGSTEHSPSKFVVETALCSAAAIKAAKLSRGVLGAAEQSMARWHEDEAQPSRQRCASAVGGSQGNEGSGGVTAIYMLAIW